MISNITYKSVPPKPILKPRPVPKLVDVVGTGNYSTGHMARDPNTCYDKQLRDYMIWKRMDDQDKVEAVAKQLNKDHIHVQSLNHMEKASFHIALRRKYKEKMDNFNADLEKRRNRLRDLFWREERDHLKEVVQLAQKANVEKYERMKQKTIELKKQNEENRRRLADEKNLERVILNYHEFRSVLSHQSVMDACKVQKIQMKENEIKRELEREEEAFWHQMATKRAEAEAERDYQEKFKKLQDINQCKEMWAIQRKEKEIRAQIMQQEKLDDLKRVEQIRLDMIRERKEGLDERRIKLEQTKKETFETIRQKEIFMKKREEEEKAQMDAYNIACQHELEKEKRMAKIYAGERKKEMTEFVHYVNRIKNEEAEQEKKNNLLVEEHKKEIERKQDEVKCKLELARQELKRATLEGRNEQLQFKNQMAVHEAKLRKAEWDTMDFYRRQHVTLAIADKQKKKIASAVYREDLLSQLEHKKKEKELEKAEMERQLQIGFVEEAALNKIVEGISIGAIQHGSTHPFKIVIDKNICQCPNARGE